MTEAGLSILVVDDEPQICRFLRASLSAEGYRVIEAGTATEALRLAASERPDVIVLDLGLPDMDGREVIRRVREDSRVPLLVLSARRSETEKVAALDLGADDYIEKPFGTGELLARIRAAHRRHLLAESGEKILRVGGLEIDFEARTVMRSGEEIRLTPREWSLLSSLARHPGKVLTHPQILKEVWGPTFADQTHYLRVYVAQLRQKLENDPGRPRILLTEPGVGYRVAAE